MPDKDPTTWTWATWLLAIGMGFSGGAVNLWAKIKSRHPRAFSIFEVIGELFTSGFVGAGSFMAAYALGASEGISAGAAGIAGHMSTRLLFALERAAEAKLKLITGGNDRAG